MELKTRGVFSFLFFYPPSFIWVRQGRNQACGETKCQNVNLCSSPRSISPPIVPNGGPASVVVALFFFRALVAQCDCDKFPTSYEWSTQVNIYYTCILFRPFFFSSTQKSIDTVVSSAVPTTRLSHTDIIRVLHSRRHTRLRLGHIY